MKTKTVPRANVIHLPKQAITPDTQNLVKISHWLELKARQKPEEAAKRIVDPQVLTFMEHYITADREHAHGEWLAGEVYWLYFKADSDTQGAFVEMLAKRNRLPLPDGSWTPRQRLVQALYGNDPDLVDDGDGKHDSKGGKRVTFAIRTFMERAGLRKRKKRAPEIVPRKTKDFLRGLYEAATDAEATMLNRLIARKYGKKAVQLNAA